MRSIRGWPNVEGNKKIQLLLRVFFLVLLPGWSLFAACNFPPAQQAPARSSAAQETGTVAPAFPIATPGQVVETGSPALPAATADPGLSFEPLSLAAPDCTYGGSLKALEALDAFTIRFVFCEPEPAFPAKAAFPVFAIYPSEWLESSAGDTTLRLEHPVGTGPYRVQEWKQGEELSLSGFGDYWGTDKASIPEIVIRWDYDPIQRLLALQAGTADGVDDVLETDYFTVQSDPALSLVYRPALSVAYLGFNNVTWPFDSQQVRHAVAMGIDYQQLLVAAFPQGYEPAQYFTPCAIPDGCVGQAWYPFDPAGARQLINEAGLAQGFRTTLTYRDVVRGYLPHPDQVAREIQAQLRESLNIQVDLVKADADAFLAQVDAGQVSGMYLSGWGADYPDVSNFLNENFGSTAPRQFGNPYFELGMLLDEGFLAPLAVRPGYYERANDMLREFVPVLPLAHGAWISPESQAVAYRAGIQGVHASPLGLERFSALSVVGQDAFVWIQNAEIGSLYCADETDLDTLRACSQVAQTLYRYSTGGAATEPSLAESCEPGVDYLSWTCRLRQGVRFQDGSELDARDVLLSFAVIWDAGHPFRMGRTGDFDYFRFFWGEFINTTSQP